MLAALSHPRLIHEWFTTALLRWHDGLVIYDRWVINFSGISTWERGSGGDVILDFYYLCYLIAFVGVLFWFRHFRKTGWLKVKPYVAYDALLLAMIGVLVGAKTAYIFIYNPDFYFNFDSPYGPVNTVDQLKRIFLNWSGMASHGAATGIVVMVFLWWLKTKRTLPMTHIGDIGCISGAFGAIWIRLANFMNGELYGRAAPEWLPWAMRFPVRSGKGNGVQWSQGELYERIDKPDDETLHEPWLERLREANPDGVIEGDSYVMFKNPDAYRQGYELQVQGAEGVEFLPPDQVTDLGWFDLVTTPRHPSQIYQLLLEGVLLLLFLLWFRRRVKRSGMVAGAFFIGYALARFIGEFFRQPDVQFQDAANTLGTVFFGLSMGQMLSLAMMVFGIGVLWYFSRHGKVIADMKMWPPDKPKGGPKSPFETGMGGSTAAGEIGGLPEIRKALEEQEKKWKEEDGG